MHKQTEKKNKDSGEDVVINNTQTMQHITQREGTKMVINLSELPSQDKDVKCDVSFFLFLGNM